MKIVKTLALAAAAFVATAAGAQELRFAHIESQKLISELPDKQAADAALQEEGKKLEDQLTVMKTDLEQKYREYIEQRETMADAIRAIKEKEITDAQQRLQSFQQMAQQTLAQKEQQLLTPIIEKYQKAIEAVGKENNFIYIFDISSQVVLYHSEASVDASEMVKAKMMAE